MARKTINYDDFKVKAFLDTNIILEGRALIDLPWDEIDADGPIIALMTPTAIKEVDSKKQDGRIGKRAREFNRLIAPVAAGGPPIVIRECGPRVELALSYAVRIPWDQHDDLDPDDGDSCIVAEALHAKHMSDQGKLLVSQDIKPIAFAANYDLETLHVSENWLRQTEPGPADKEVQRLRSKLAEYEAKEPEFQISIAILDDEPLLTYQIEDLTSEEREDIEHKIVAANPQKSQAPDRYGIMEITGQYDASYSDRYIAYRKLIPVFIQDYARRLERLFNQARFSVVVTNRGKMQAENLLVEMSISGGWLHDRYVWVSPLGPKAPSLRTDRFLPTLSHLREQRIAPSVGRHEFAFKDKPKWRPYLSVMCEDFRHGQDWTYEGVMGLDSHEQETEITVTVTASNFRGKAELRKVVRRRIQPVHFSELFDRNSLKILAPIPIKEVLSKGEHEKIDFKAFALEIESES